MSAISLRLPDSLHKKVKEVADRDNVSINQMITVALAEKLSALETEYYLGKRAQKGSRDKYLKALSRVPDRAPDKKDEL
jgi:predicted transcriptional regulator